MKIELTPLTQQQIDEGKQPVPDGWLPVDALSLGDQVLRIYVYQDESGVWHPAKRWHRLDLPQEIRDQLFGPQDPAT